MTREEAIARIREHMIIHKGKEPRAIYITEALDMAIKALETPPNDNWEGYSSRLWKNAYERGKAEAEQTMGCNGCKYEETGNNTTYPCSHCSRCYTDKYKAENDDKEEIK